MSGEPGGLSDVLSNLASGKPTTPKPGPTSQAPPVADLAAAQPAGSPALDRASTRARKPSTGTRRAGRAAVRHRGQRSSERGLARVAIPAAVLLGVAMAGFALWGLMMLLGAVEGPANRTAEQVRPMAMLMLVGGGAVAALLIGGAVWYRGQHRG